MKRLFALILIMATLLSLGACAQKAEATWQQQYDLGVRYLNEGKYEEAIIAFNAAIEIDPKQADAYTALANTYVEIGDYQAAADVLEQGRENCGDTEEFSRMAGYTDFLASEEQGVQISDIQFDKTKIASGNAVEFTITAAYRCPEGVDCIVMTGANTEAPFDYRMLEADVPVSGTGVCTYTVSVTPVDWGGIPFVIYTNLSEADHDSQWTPLGSDSICMDMNGNILPGEIWDYVDPSGDEGDSYYNDISGGVVAAEIVGGTLDIRNLQITFVPGEDEYNPGAVGRAEYSFTVYGPENLHVVLIGMWTEGSFDRNSIYDEVSMMAERWRDMDISDWGYHGLPADDWNARPVDSYEIDKVCETILIGLDKNGDVVGYSVIRQQISSSGDAGDIDLGAAGFVPTEPANLPSFSEVTFLGQSPEGLTAMQMEEIAAQNGYNVTNNQGWGMEDGHYWFQAESKDSWGVHISGMQYDYENQWSYLGYTHYYEYTEYAPISIGLRDIYTHESLSSVLVKLGVPNAEELAQKIENIRANYTFEEAIQMLGGEEFSHYDMAKDVYFTVGNGGGSGSADENGVYYLESMSASLSFRQDMVNYDFRFEFTNGILTGASLNRYEAGGMG